MLLLVLAFLTKRSDREGAIEYQKQQIENLKSVLELDNLLEGRNRIRQCLEEAEKALDRLQREGATKQAEMEAYHSSYITSYGSANYCMMYRK